MLELEGQRLSLSTLAAVASGQLKVGLSAKAFEAMAASRAIIERIISEGRVVYGVNTGFGKLSEVTIPTAELRDLQHNLVRSHACGVGPLLFPEETRTMLLLRANVIAKGFSGARPVVVETLLKMLEHDVLPCIPEKGSVGASGDLAPLAHLALVAIGEGEATYRGKRMGGKEAMASAGIQVIELEAKEGLALLNGTQAMVSVGGLALDRADRIVQLADQAGAMTLEALKGTPAAFDPRIHAARPHEGQMVVAANLTELLRDSEIRLSHLDGDPRVQDAYSLRCMPQVHGATRNAVKFAREALEIETGSATDNPLVFQDNGDVISGGNFHGAPIAQALDFAAIALTDLASMSERRIDRLINPDLNEGLPAFLTSHAGASSGFMIAHVTAVALLNECKVLSHPASIDNLPTSAGKEDHVSMGMVAACKLRTITQNVAHIFAIELMAGAEGLEYRRPLRAGKGVEEIYEKVRQTVPRLKEDRALGKDIEALAKAVC